MCLRYRVIYAIFFIAACFITAKVGFGEILATVKLIHEVNVAHRVVRLGDISTVESRDKQLKAKIEAVEICTVDKPGNSRVIGVAHIRAKLYRANLNPKLFSFEGKQVNIVTKAITISAGDILSQVRKYLRANIPHNKANIEVKPISSIKPVSLPDGDVKIEIATSASDIFGGRLEALFFVNEKLYDKQRLSVKIYATYSVLIAKQDIPKNTPIDKNYLKLAERKLSGSNFSAMTELSEVVGKISKTHIAKDSIITAKILKALPLVVRGDIITLVAYSKLLRIRTKGTALQNGEYGQLVRVANLNSKKTVVGEVIGPKLVRVYFSKRSVTVEPRIIRPRR